MFNPSSTAYEYESYELKYNGENEDVTLDNVEDYIELVTDFCLNSGIRKQMAAFRGKLKITVTNCHFMYCL